VGDRDPASHPTPGVFPGSGRLPDLNRQNAKRQKIRKTGDWGSRDTPLFDVGKARAALTASRVVAKIAKISGAHGATTSHPSKAEKFGVSFGRAARTETAASARCATEKRRVTLLTGGAVHEWC